MFYKYSYDQQSKIDLKNFNTVYLSAKEINLFALNTNDISEISSVIFVEIFVTGNNRKNTAKMCQQ